MKKNIFDMLNDSNINLDDYEKVELNDIEKMKMKKFVKKNIHPKSKIKMLKVAALVAVIGGSLLVTPFGQNVIASINLPFYEIGYSMGLNRDLNDYKTVIDQSISDNGVTIKLNEVILDGDMLKLSAITHINNSNKEYIYIGGDAKIYINGKKMNSGSSGGGQMINNNTFASEDDFTVDLDKIDLTKPLDVKIDFYRVYASTENQSGHNNPIRGDWNFEFTIHPQELIADTITIPLNKTITADDGQELTIKDYTSNEVGQKLYVKYKDDSFIDNDERLIGTDNLGNPVEFYLRYRNENDAMFEIYQLDGGLSKDATQITLQLQIVDLPEGGGEIPDDYRNVGEPFTIDLK